MHTAQESVAERDQSVIACEGQLITRVRQVKGIHFVIAHSHRVGLASIVLIETPQRIVHWANGKVRWIDSNRSWHWGWLRIPRANEVGDVNNPLIFTGVPGITRSWTNMDDRVNHAKLPAGRSHDSASISTASKRRPKERIGLHVVDGFNVKLLSAEGRLCRFVAAVVRIHVLDFTS
mgnify:CR=1 FL=1